MAVVCLLVGAAVFLVATRGDDEASRPLPPPRSPGPLDPEARELIDLVTRGRSQTVHARYRSTGDTPASGAVTVEVWRKGGRIRQDTEIRMDGRVVRTAAIQGPRPDEVVICQRRDDEPWRCSRADEAAPATTGDLLDQVVADLTGRDVEARDAEVAGVKARCFIITGAGRVGEACTTPQGVTVRVGVEGRALELIHLDTEVADDLFRPPVPPE